MRVAVTGAGGYIGSVLTGRLLKEGHSVLGIDRFFFGEETLADFANNSRFTLVRNDIRFLKPDDLKNIDVVMDLAGLSNDPSCDMDEKTTFSINHKGTVNVAKAAKAAGVKQYIFSSSCSVYGFGGDQIFTEESALNPISCYAKSKIKSEEEIDKLSDKNFCITFLRNATVYGLSPRMRFDLVINLMTLLAWKNKKIYVMGGGKQWRPVVHLNDVVSAFMLIMKSPAKKVNGQVYNVGSSEQNYQIEKLARIVQECFEGVALEVIPEDADKRSYRVGFEKIRKDLKFKVKEDPSTAAKKIMEALRLGHTVDDLRTKTVDFYKYLIEAETLLKKLKIKNRLF